MLKIENNLSKNDLKFISDKVVEYNKKQDAKHYKNFSFCIRNKKGNIISGIFGEMFFGLCYIDYLWTDEKCREKGLATKLMNEVEALAKKEGCKYLLVDTMEYQAPEFYKKYGFNLSLELPNCEGNNIHYTLAKKLK